MYLSRPAATDLLPRLEEARPRQLVGLVVVLLLPPLGLEPARPALVVAVLMLRPPEQSEDLKAQCWPVAVDNRLEIPEGEIAGL